jgi:hypothetical protein
MVVGMVVVMIVVMLMRVTMFVVVLMFVSMFMRMAMFVSVGMLVLLQAVNGDGHMGSGDAAGGRMFPLHLYPGQTQTVHLVHKRLRIGE